MGSHRPFGADGGTLSYSHDPYARLTLPYGTKYTGFTLTTGTKADRGTFGISVGPGLTYHGSAKGPCKTNCPENNLSVQFPRCVVVARPLAPPRPSLLSPSRSSD